MSRWVRAAASADIPDGCALECLVEDRIVAVFRVEGVYHALDGVCPHQGGPLGKGRLNGCVLTCPWHGWQFDVTNGCLLIRPSLVQPRYETRVEGDEVQVYLED